MLTIGFVYELCTNVSVLFQHKIVISILTQVNKVNYRPKIFTKLTACRDLHT